MSRLTAGTTGPSHGYLHGILQHFHPGRQQAQQDQLISPVENSLAARIDLHATGGANGQHQYPAQGPQLNLGQAAPGQSAEFFLACGELNALNLILGARKHLHEARCLGM